MAIRLPVGSSLDETVKVVNKVEGIIFEEVPELKSLWSRSGSGTGGNVIFSGRFAGPHTANASLMLFDQSERSQSSDMIARSLREKIRQIPGATFSIYPGGLVTRIITFGNDDPIDVEIL
jgi:multidrug efflux pump subunit AcrB